MKKHNMFFARVVGFGMALALSVLVLSVVLWGLGTDAALMQAQFERFAPSERTGLAARYYPEVAEMLTGYLAGDVDSFQFFVEGVPQFHDYEQTHMADCRALFVLDRTVLIGSACVLIVLLAAAILLRAGRGTASGFFAGSMLVLGVVIAVGLVGAIDFDRLFILFHQLSFDNSLWLLNPATDLLIRMMPTAFFISYAGRGLALWLGALVLMAAVSGCLTLGRKHKR